MNSFKRTCKERSLGQVFLKPDAPSLIMCTTDALNYWHICACTAVLQIWKRFSCSRQLSRPAGLVERDGHQRLLAPVEYAGAQVDAAPRVLPGPARRHPPRLGRHARLCSLSDLPRAASRPAPAHGPLLGLRWRHVSGAIFSPFLLPQG